MSLPEAVFALLIFTAPLTVGEGAAARTEDQSNATDTIVVAITFKAFICKPPLDFILKPLLNTLSKLASQTPDISYAGLPKDRKKARAHGRLARALLQVSDEHPRPFL